MKFKRMIPAVIALSVAMSNTAFAGTWKMGDGENQSKWWYDNEDGSYANNGWQWIDRNNDGIAECFYFDENGWLYENMTTPDGYTVNSDGAWVNNGQVETKIMEQNLNNETSNVDGKYTHTGYYYDGKFIEWKPEEADATVEYIILTEIDPNTVKAEIWGAEVHGSEAILKKDGNSYVFESGKLSDLDIYYDLFDGLGMEQFIYELHIEGDTLKVKTAWKGMIYDTVSIFKR